MPVSIWLTWVDKEVSVFGNNASCVCFLHCCIILMDFTGEQPCRATRLQFQLWHSVVVARGF